MHLMWISEKSWFNLQLKKASLLPRGAFSASTDHKEPHSPIELKRLMWAWLYIEPTLKEFQSQPAGDPVDSDPKLALFTRSSSTLTGVGTDGLIPHEVPPSTKLWPFSPALPVQLKDVVFSLGGDCRPRTTSAHCSRVGHFLDQLQLIWLSLCNVAWSTPT